jgi:hypothetical protein
MEKEKWIENIINSTNGITKVSPSNQLFSKIQSKIDEEKTVEGYTKWLVAASIAILISLNTLFLVKENTTSQKNELTELVSSVNNQLYY